MKSSSFIRVVSEIDDANRQLARLGMGDAAVGEGAGLEGGLTFVVKLNVKYFVMFVHLYLHFLVGLPRLA